ncbi:MAG TPA: WD40 repeat domain-containing protein, partial [Pseudonocardiaceae bacterium]
GEDNAVRLWDLNTKAQAAALTGPTNTVADIAFSPDGHTLAGADDDATIGLWNIAAAPAPGNTAVTAVASGTAPGGVLVTAGPDQRINLWDPLERVRTTTFGPARGSATATTTLPTDIAVGPAGTTLLTSGGDGVRIWDTARRSLVCTLPTSAGVNAVTYRPATGPGATTMIAAGGENDDIYLWPHGTCGTTPIAIPTNQFGPITTVAFSPDGTVLAAGSDDGTILLERVDTADTRSPIILSQPIGHLNSVTSIAFSPDGRTLASGSDDGKIMLWDIVNPRNPTTVATLPTPDETVLSMAFSGDGATLAASADNHTISLWHTHTPATPGMFATLTGLTNPSDVVFEPGGHMVVSAAADGTPVFWDTDPDDIAAKICTSPVPDADHLLAPYLTGAEYQSLCPAP